MGSKAAKGGRGGYRRESGTLSAKRQTVREDAPAP